MAELRWCQHCKRKIARRPRELCNRCYYTPEIRQIYEPKLVQVHGDKTYQSTFYNPPKSGLKPASQPTNARPGTTEKLTVFKERVANGEELFHPQDFTVLPQWMEEVFID